MVRRRVSTHSRLKAAGSKLSSPVCRPPRFNTQPPEGGWELSVEFEEVLACFNTQPPEGGWSKQPIQTCRLTVSTHSRLKAAGTASNPPSKWPHGFNTQPPEGGWGRGRQVRWRCGRFNTQPPEGGWTTLLAIWRRRIVSTHSRLKAAGVGREL